MTASDSPAVKVTADLLGNWATDPAGPVALHMKQKLLPVTAENDEPGIIYPPTYADIGYSIDTLSDEASCADRQRRFPGEPHGADLQAAVLGEREH